MSGRRVGLEMVEAPGLSCYSEGPLIQILAASALADSATVSYQREPRLSWYKKDFKAGTDDGGNTWLYRLVISRT